MQTSRTILHQAASLLPPWYRANARALPWRADKEPYHVWLSEIMLQQTRAAAADAYYRRFLSALPDVAALAAADEETVLKLWEGLGYYSRARNLQKAARVIVDELGGTFPDTYEGIFTLPGVGPYTAGAIASICFGLPCPAVDGNVLRVVSRLTEYDKSVDTDEAKKEIADALRPCYRHGDCGVLTQSLMELGACVCVPNGVPGCGVCPLNGICLANKHGAWERYPLRSQKKARRIVYKTVLLLECGEMIAVRKRPAKGLLAGLWEFPNADVPERSAQTPDAAAALAASLGAKPLEMTLQTEWTHIFTHVEWHMRGFRFACGAMPETLRWVTREELARELALPGAFRPLFETI